MQEYAREAMKKAIIALLNASLKSQDFTDVEVTAVSDDFETAHIKHKNGTSGTVRSEIIFPIEEDIHVQETDVNRGINAESVRKLRENRIGRYQNQLLRRKH